MNGFPTSNKRKLDATLEDFLYLLQGEEEGMKSPPSKKHLTSPVTHKAKACGVSILKEGFPFISLPPKAPRKMIKGPLAASVEEVEPSTPLLTNKVKKSAAQLVSKEFLEHPLNAKTNQPLNEIKEEELDFPELLEVFDDLKLQAEEYKQELKTDCLIEGGSIKEAHFKFKKQNPFNTWYPDIRIPYDQIEANRRLGETPIKPQQAVQEANALSSKLGEEGALDGEM